MTKLTVQHRTTYAYHRPVQLGPHRLMLRPRESPELRVCAHTVNISPAAELSWASDVFGNIIATANFTGQTDTLVIEGVTEVELSTVAWPVFSIAAAATRYPFRYSDADWTDLAPLAAQQYPDPDHRLSRWAGAFVAGPTTDTLSLLRDLSAGVPAWISYQSRDDEGTQSPTETLRRGWGSCRDFAVLFVEAVRSLGFGARLVSGYLFDPDGQLVGLNGAGSTHAWAEVFVPGAGWISFDPTNRSMGGHNLIPVAVTRAMEQAAPVSGSFHGSNDALTAMSVSVSVSPTLGA